MSSNPIKSSAKWSGKVGGQNYGGTSPSEMARRNAAYSKSEAAAHQLDAKVRAALDSYGLPNLGTYMAAAREFNRIVKRHSGPTLIAELSAIANKWADAMGLDLTIIVAMVLSVFGINLAAIVPVPVSGVINYLNVLNTAMHDTTIKLFQGGVEKYSGLSGVGGDYVFPGVFPGVYDVVCTTGMPWGGVNAADKIAIENWIAAPFAIEVVRFMAGDITSGAGNAGDPPDQSWAQIDADTALNLFTGVFLYGQFLRGKCVWWPKGDTIAVNPAPGVPVYYPTLIVPAGGPAVVLDLYCSCVGDVNGNYFPIW
jgi:hypothetical protein